MTTDSASVQTQRYMYRLASLRPVTLQPQTRSCKRTPWMCCPCWFHPHHLELCVHLSAMCSTGDVVLTGSYRTVTVSSSGISSLYVGGVTEVSSQQCGWTQAGAGLSWPKSTSGLRFGWQSAGIEHGNLLAAALALVGSCNSQQAAGGAALLFPATLAS